MLSILNSQTKDTDQATAQKGVTIKGLISLIPTIVDAVTHDQEQAKKQSSLIHPIFPSPFVWPRQPFYTRKGTANAQEEQPANAQVEPLTIAIIAALIGVGGSLITSIIGPKISELLPFQELANAQGLKKVAGKVGGSVAGSVAGGATGAAVGGAINGQVRAEDIDLAEIFSLIENDQQIRDILNTLRDAVADALSELAERVGADLVDLIEGTGGEQAKMERGLTPEELFVSMLPALTPEQMSRLRIHG